jgi:hypothetical protein
MWWVCQSRLSKGLNCPSISARAPCSKSLKPGFRLFEHGNLSQIDGQLERFDKQLWQTHHMFLPHVQRLTGNPAKFFPEKMSVPVKWFEGKALHQFYEDGKYPNALCKKYDPKRPDVLAVASYEGDAITAMAGCSADTPDLWQIGIDVNEPCRGCGLGTYLVTLLKNEVLSRGKIPFYGTGLSHIHSWNVALNSGFFPAWVEIATVEESTTHAASQCRLTV